MNVIDATHRQSGENHRKPVQNQWKSRNHGQSLPEQRGAMRCTLEATAVCFICPWGVWSVLCPCRILPQLFDAGPVSWRSWPSFSEMKGCFALFCALVQVSKLEIRARICMAVQKPCAGSARQRANQMRVAHGSMTAGQNDEVITKRRCRKLNTCGQIDY